MTTKWTNKKRNINIRVPEYISEAMPATGPDGLYLDYALRFKSLNKQLESIPHHILVNELRSCGVWTKNELKDREQNKRRLLHVVFYDLYDKHTK